MSILDDLGLPDPLSEGLGIDDTSSIFPAIPPNVDYSGFDSYDEASE